jgi:hypothetical protein
VLDSDRRLRQQFWPALSPLAGCTDALQFLGNVTREQSRAWLCSVLIEAILDNAEGNSIGAASTLCRILPDHHEKCQKVLDRLETTSAQFRSCLFVQVARQEFDEEPELPAWLLRLAIISLTASDWSELSPAGIEAAFETLSIDLDKTRDAAEACGMHHTLAAILPELLKPFEKPFDRNESEERRVETKYGVVEMEISKLPAVHFEAWTPDAWRALGGASGAFGLIGAVLLWAKSRNADDYEAVRQLLSGKNVLLSVLPPRVSTYLPTRWHNRIGIAELASQQDFGHISYLRFGRFGRPDWAGVSAEYPELLLHLLSEPFLRARVGSRRQDTEWVELEHHPQTPQGFAEFLEAVDKDPQLLRGFPHAWGKLVEIAGDRSPQLVPLLHRCAAFPVPDNLFVRRIAPFRLHLPADLSLLPHLANLLTIWAMEEDLNRDPQTVSELTREFIDDARTLRGFIEREELSPAIRAGAIVLHILHPDRYADEDFEALNHAVSIYKLGYQWMVSTRPGAGFN